MKVKEIINRIKYPNDIVVWVINKENDFDKALYNLNSVEELVNKFGDDEISFDLENERKYTIVYIKK